MTGKDPSMSWHGLQGRGRLQALRLLKQKVISETVPQPADRVRGRQGKPPQPDTSKCPFRTQDMKVTGRGYETYTSAEKRKKH